MENKKEKHGHHLVPLEVYWRVFAALITLTIITVATSYIDFGGSMNIVIAMGIATAKALLVTLIFMGLKYDSAENNITFFSAFAFLSIFVVLTSFDLFYRPDLTAAKVDASDLAQSADAVDVTALLKSTPELVAKGKTIFGQQCMTCHGPEGKGDGPAAGALNPKPRNFTSADGWKAGRTVAQIFKTVTDGLPGTPMPPFSGISASDRLALVHFIRSITPSPPADEAGALDALAKQAGGPRKPRLSIDAALDKVSNEWSSAHGK
jgi:caa(3)-type oxidase subunit IV